MPSKSDTKDMNFDISLLKKKDYKLIRELGTGSCGKTVLLKDEEIDEFFV